MDAPTANQSQTPCPPWAGQNGWSPASPPGPPCNPLPSFQHFSLGSPSEQRPCHDPLQAPHQGCQSDPTASSSTPDSTLCASDARQGVQRSIPDARVSSVAPAASQGRNVPPCSLPLMNKGTQPRKPQQMPLYSPRSPYQAISSPFQSPYAHQGLLNGPQSPHQKHLPISSPSFGQCVNQSPQCTPQPAFRGANVASSVSHASPASPVQQQPQWTISPQSRGRFICNMYMACCRPSHRS